MSTGTLQCAALLAALRQAPISSVDARERLGILHPAGRVMELRQQGFPIKLLWRITEDAQGRRHRAGTYALEGVTT